MSVRTFFVYLVTNTVNGKVYVGKTHQPHIRWKQHLRSASRGDVYLLQRAIRKYGTGVFAFQILAEYQSEESALAGEQCLIREFRSSEVRRGYNMTLGGDGVRPTPETHTKMCAAAQRRAREKPISAEQREKIAAALRGHSQSDETKEKRRASLTRWMAGRTQTPAELEGLERGRGTWSEAKRAAVIAGMSTPESRAKRQASSKASAAARRAAGLPCGSIPYGKRANAEGKLEANPNEQMVIETARRLQARGFNCAEIIRELSWRGIRSRNGKPFVHAQVRLYLLPKTGP